jgi:hypothetical protein
MTLAEGIVVKPPIVPSNVDTIKDVIIVICH